MGWTEEFYTELAKPANAPHLIFTAGGWFSNTDGSWVTWAAGALPPNDSGVTAASSGPWWGSACTGDATGRRPDFKLDPLRVRLPEQRWDPVAGTCTGGSWVVEIEHPGDSNVAFLAAGTFAVLAMGFAGWTRQQYQRIAMGFILSVTWQNARLRVVVGDLLAICNGDRPHAPEAWGKRSVEQDLNGDYTAGDSTLDMGDTSAFDGYADKDGVYTLRCMPAYPEMTDIFVLTATGKTSTTFTGVSATGEWSTTAIDMTAGVGFIGSAFRVEGHPMNVIRNVLASTGDGTNGAHDIEPALVGYALPDELLDHDDIDDVWMAAVAPATGALQVDFLVARLGDLASFYPDTVNEGLRGIQITLAALGLWPVTRQGQITCRALQDLDDAPITSGITIGNRDICTCEIDWFQNEQAQEYRVWEVIMESATASMEEDATFLCKAQKISFDLSTVVRGNETAVADSLEVRVAPWFLQRAERLRLLVRGSVYARLCPGDVVEVTADATDQYRPIGSGRLPDTYAGVSALKFMVSTVRWLLPMPAVQLELIRVPAAGSEMPAY